MSSFHIGVFIDASFARKNDTFSWIGFIVCLADVTNTVIVLRYCSMKAECIARSDLAAELLATTYAFNQASVFRLSIGSIFGRNIRSKLNTKSCSLYGCLVLQKKLQKSVFLSAYTSLNSLTSAARLPKSLRSPQVILLLMRLPNNVPYERYRSFFTTILLLLFLNISFIGCR